jgi:lipopolysaccharide biosynthesis glycosyltransferase
MKGLLQTQDHPRQISDSNAPEHEFLSMHFGSRWTALPVKFNWQPHQLRYLFDGRSTKDGDGCDRMNIDYEKIEIVHFSAKEKPRDFLFEQVEGGRKRSKEQFKEFLIESYLKQEYAKVTFEVRAKIARSIDEWFQAWAKAWEYVLTQVAQCAQRGGVSRCPMCGSQKLGVADPMHCFFWCDSKEVATLVRTWEIRHHQAFRKLVADPMVSLRDAATYPWSIQFVEQVYKLRQQRRNQSALTGSRLETHMSNLKDQIAELQAQLQAAQLAATAPHCLAETVNRRLQQQVLQPLAELKAQLGQREAPGRITDCPQANVRVSVSKGREAAIAMEVVNPKSGALRAPATTLADRSRSPARGQWGSWKKNSWKKAEKGSWKNSRTADGWMDHDRETRGDWVNWIGKLPT